MKQATASVKRAGTLPRHWTPRSRYEPKTKSKAKLKGMLVK